MKENLFPLEKVLCFVFIATFIVFRQASWEFLQNYPLNIVDGNDFINDWRTKLRREWDHEMIEQMSGTLPRKMLRLNSKVSKSCLHKAGIKLIKKAQNKTKTLFILPSKQKKWF